MSFFNVLWEGIKSTSVIEWLAVSSSIMYVILAAKRLIICWFFGFFGSLLFVYLCYVGDLYIESFLQFFYVIMAVVGWFSWNNFSSNSTQIIKWQWMNHLLNFLLCGFASLMIGYIFDLFTSQANPYIDAVTTCYSLSATYMVTRKIIGNWIYWIVIDVVSVFLYAQQNYYLTAVQYGVFALLAVYGYLTWKKEYYKQTIKT